MRINLYDQGRHTVIVDGIPMTGFAEGDFLEIELEGGAASRTLGGDGPAMNLSVPQGGKILLSLNPVSPQLGDLYAIRESQSISPRLFSVQLMTGVSEVISASGCAFGPLPSFSTGSDKQQPRQFDIQALRIKMDTSGVEAVAGGFLGGLLG